MGLNSHYKGIVEDVGVARVTVRVPDLDNLVTDWLDVLQPAGLGLRWFVVPRAGTQVAISPGLGLEDAVVMGCIYSKPDPAPFQDPMLLGFEADDGTVVYYDPTDSLLKVDAVGRIEVKAATTVRVEAGSDMSLKSGGKMDLEAGGTMTLRAPMIEIN